MTLRVENTFVDLLRTKDPFLVLPERRPLENLFKRENVKEVERQICPFTSLLGVENILKTS